MDKSKFWKGSTLTMGIVIAVLVGIIIIMSQCSGKKDKDCPICEEPGIIVRIDSFPHIVEKPVPGPIRWKYKDSIVYCSIPIPPDVDTQAIIEDYFADVYYSDSAYNADKSIFVKTEDVLSMNRLKSRKWFIQDLTPDAIVIPEKKRMKLFLGGKIGGGLDHFSCGVGALLQTKNERIYGLHYDIFPRQSVSLSMYWKIQLRKKKYSEEFSSDFIH